MECRMRRHTHTTWAITTTIIVCQTRGSQRRVLVWRTHSLTSDSSARQKHCFGLVCVCVCVGYAHYCYGFHWMSAECKENAFPFVSGHFFFFLSSLRFFSIIVSNRNEKSNFMWLVRDVVPLNVTSQRNNNLFIIILCVIPHAQTHTQTLALMFPCPYVHIGKRSQPADMLARALCNFYIRFHRNLANCAWQKSSTWEYNGFRNSFYNMLAITLPPIHLPYQPRSECQRMPRETKSIYIKSLNITQNERFSRPLSCTDA